MSTHRLRSPALVLASGCAMRAEAATRPTTKGYALLRAEDGAVAGRAELYLYDVVGADWFGEGLTAKQVIDDLQALGKVDGLDVRINSPGGDVFDGVAIYNALVRFGAPVTVHVDGLAASIASLIAMAGDEIRIAENAMFMLHQPYTIAMGTAADMRAVATSLEKAWSAMLATYQRRTGRRAETITKKIDDAGGEWWLTAAEAKKEGFADDVEKSAKAAAVYGLDRFRHAPAALAAAAVTEEPRRTWPAPRAAEVAAPRKTRAPEGPSPAARAAHRRRVVQALRASG